MNQFYKYHPLDRTKREIRLVRIKDFVRVTAFTRDPIASDLYERDDVYRTMIEKDFPIQCSIEHAFLDDKPPYVALSYTWGNSTNKKPIHVTNENGTVTTLQVTQNVYAALRHIRPDLLPDVENDTLLWIDAICINQTDDDEKSWQVQQMLHIYRNALNVLAWLGPRTDGSAEFMDEMAEELEVQMMKTLGCSARSIQISMHNLALIFRSQGRNGKAVSLIRDCFELRKQILGLKHPYTKSSLEDVRGISQG
ncbi:MAG: hypothetical protein M1839_001637 [Geoglossum umbratile]|nr:MAG: hypothetical protein M1839_001637 [Geoglossum umbratile]